MDAAELNELNAHAQQVAGRLGVGAAVSLIETERSSVDPGGPRLELRVFRDMAGQLQEVSKNLSMDRPDLKALIEEEIEVMAPQLSENQ
jgi:hypothetical protein